MKQLSFEKFDLTDSKNAELLSLSPQQMLSIRGGNGDDGNEPDPPDPWN